MAENDVNVEEKTLNDESRLSLLNDALYQASHKVINKILISRKIIGGTV